MEEKKFNIDDYLERIGYKGGLEISSKTLRELHVGHVTHIPFENLHPLQGKSVSLNREDLFEKIVHQKRGGYCFEMNGLFSHVLKELGFQVTDVFARVYRPDFGFSGRAHQVLIVDVDGERWMADVGFGGNGPIAPVKIEEDTEQEQYGRYYRLKSHPVHENVLEFKVEDGYETVYAFTSEACYPMDYDIANHFTSTHPDSVFRKLIMCTMPTKEGRVSMFDNNLKVIENGKVEQKVLESDNEIRQALVEYFGLSFETSYQEHVSSR